MERVIRRDGNVSLNDRDMALYRLIARSSKNIPFLLVLNFFNNSGLVGELLTLYFADPANIGRTTRFYNEIYEAIRGREAEKSKGIMYDLLVYAEARTLEILTKHLGGE